MIEFIYSPKNIEGKCAKRISKGYPEILKNEGEFQIKVNGTLYFDEPNFSVDEFLLNAERWLTDKDKAQDMRYFSVDTDDNPLISFSMKNDCWYVDSPWRLFECNVSFTRDELEKAVSELKKSVG